MSVEAARNAHRARRHRPGGHRRRLRRLGVPPLRGEALGHGRRRGHRRRTGGALRGPRVRLQGRHRGDVRGATALVKAGEIEYAPRRSAPTPPRARPATPSSTRPRPAPPPSSSAPTTTDRRRRSMHTYSFMTDTPDFWRREYMHYPRHAGRFTGEPAYFKHTTRRGARHPGEGRASSPTDFAYAVFHQPNGKFPMRVGKMLGFTEEQIEDRLAVALARQHLLGRLAHRPDGDPRRRQARRPHPDDLLRLRRRLRRASSSRVTEPHPRGPGPGAARPGSSSTNSKIYLDYGTYAKFRGKIRMARVRRRTMRDVAVIGIGLVTVRRAVGRTRCARSGPRPRSRPSRTPASTASTPSRSAACRPGCSSARSTWRRCSPTSSAWPAVPATRVESACASGGARPAGGLRRGRVRARRHRAGQRRREDDRRRRRRRAPTPWRTAADQECEVFHGVTFPGLYAMMARAHMQRVRHHARAARPGGGQEPRQRPAQPARPVPP